MQAGPELSNGLKERQIACIEETMGFHVARMIHIYLYAANRLWDTDRISRLRRLPLKRRAMTPLRNLRCQREDRSSGSMTRALVEDSTGRLFGGQSTSHYSSDHRENRKHVLPDGGSGRVVGYLGW